MAPAYARGSLDAIRPLGTSERRRLMMTRGGLAVDASGRTTEADHLVSVLVAQTGVGLPD